MRGNDCVQGVLLPLTVLLSLSSLAVTRSDSQIFWVQYKGSLNESYHMSHLILSHELEEIVINRTRQWRIGSEPVPVSFVERRYTTFLLICHFQYCITFRRPVAVLKGLISQVREENIIDRESQTRQPVCRQFHSQRSICHRRNHRMWHCVLSLTEPLSFEMPLLTDNPLHRRFVVVCWQCWTIPESEALWFLSPLSDNSHAFHVIYVISYRKGTGRGR